MEVLCQDSVNFHMGAVVVNNSNWNSCLWEKLFRMRHQNLCCDVSLMGSDSEMIPAHSCVLAAASSYISNTITTVGSNFHDQMLRIQIPDISGSTLENVIKFIYTGCFSIGLDEVEEMQTVAELLCLPELQQICSDVIDKYSTAITEHKTKIMKQQEEYQKTIFEQNEEIKRLNDILKEFSTQYNEPPDVNCNADVAEYESVGSYSTSLTHESHNLCKLQVSQGMETEDESSLDLQKGFEDNLPSGYFQEYSQETGTVDLLPCERTMTDQQSRSNIDQSPCQMSTVQSSVKDDHPTAYEEMATVSLDTLSMPDDQLSPNAAYMFCDVCNKSFDNASSLEHHKLTHLEDKPHHQCYECGSQFKTKYSLQNHLLTHGEKNFVCQVCKKSFHTAPGLVNHKKSHPDHFLFQCGMCQMVFKERSLLVHHLSLTHRAAPAKLKCPKCSKEFSLEGNLQRHLRTHYSETSQSSNKPSVQCDVEGCSFVGSKARDVYRHKLKVHKAEKFVQAERTQENYPDDVEIKVEPDEGDALVQAAAMKTFTCRVCGKKFSFPSRLRRHIAMRHQKKKRYQCKLCLYSNYHIREVRLHFSNKHPLVPVPNDESFILAEEVSMNTPDDSSMLLPCSECDFYSSSSEELEQHFKALHPQVFQQLKRDTTFLCTECGGAYKTKSALNNHIAVQHRAVKRFACTLCNYSSYFLSYVKEHFLAQHKGIPLPDTSLFKIACEQEKNSK